MANESRLIDVDVAEKSIRIAAASARASIGCGYDEGWADALSSVADMLKTTPIVDAVEVTRCKGCQEYEPGFIRPYLGWCSVWDTTVRETGFCHHGSPRSEEKPNPAWPPQEEMEEPCED